MMETSTLADCSSEFGMVEAERVKLAENPSEAAQQKQSQKTKYAK